MDNNKTTFHRSLSLLDGSLLVIGSMIGSGIFVVSSEIVRGIGSAGWLIVVWLLSGLITVLGALSFGELSGAYPHAGGQYVYLREAYGKLYAFLYGWSFFAVIQTGTIAAVGVIFARYAAYFFPALSEDHVLFTIGSFSVSAAQALSIGIITLLTFVNTLGVESGKWIQLLFTFAKVAALAVLIIAGIFLVTNHEVWHLNWSDAWFAKTISKDVAGTISHRSLSGSDLVIALGTVMVGALFSSDAWNNVTFIAGEIRRPERNIGLSLFIGTFFVTILYLLMNFMYLNTLTIGEIANPAGSRVAIAAALKIPLLGAAGAAFIATVIMISTFGCNNGLILSGARVYNAMAKDDVFLPAAKKLNRRGVPAKALWMQCAWASLLCLSGRYNDLLDFIIFTVLLFYILTIAGVFVLRQKAPEVHRPYKVPGYPVLPALYIILASTVCIILLLYKPAQAWSGLGIVLAGIPVYYLITRNAKKETNPNEG